MATLQGLWLLKRPNVASGQAISNSYWRVTCTSSRASGGRRSCTAATVNHSANLVGVGDTAAETAAATAAPPTPLASVSKRDPSVPAAAANKQRRAEEDGDGDGEWLRYLEPARLEVFDQLEPWAEANVLPLLRPAESAWQPSEMLPDAAALGADGFHTACCELRARAAGVPDAVLVCLVGNMMTEEALPTYQSMHNRFEGVRDLTGAGATAWARWIRGWSAEENRHGDVLSRYLFLSGRVDMRQVDRTIHRLISSGMVLAAARSPYHGFIYVAFQERATAISHGNTARRAGEHGDAALARICGAVAGDEKRHEAAYTRIVGKLFEVDPDGAVRALAYMMRRRITMPASLMSDGRGSDGDLFARYAAVAQGAGVYTAADYRGIVEHLIKQWRVEELGAGLSGEGRRAQDYVCALPRKIRRLEEKAHLRSRAQKHTLSVPFSWIFDRSIILTV